MDLDDYRSGNEVVYEANLLNAEIPIRFDDGLGIVDDNKTMMGRTATIERWLYLGPCDCFPSVKSKPMQTEFDIPAQENTKTIFEFPSLDFMAEKAYEAVTTDVGECCS